MLIIHEVMGRNCGWLTAATATYRERLKPSWSSCRSSTSAPVRRTIDAVYIPELAHRHRGRRRSGCKRIMDEKDCVNFFCQRGRLPARIVEEMVARGEKVDRDAFGHVKLDKVNVGDWFSKQSAKLVGAEKTLVQKSGYFARSAAANADDRRLIQRHGRRRRRLRARRASRA